MKKWPLKGWPLKEWPRIILSGLTFRMTRWFGRPSITIKGYWGRFRGHGDDLAMLRHYGVHGTWSAGTVNLLAQTARELVVQGEPAPLLLDIGAAIGLISIGVLRQAPGHALAVESYPETFSHLQHNISMNRMHDRIEAKKLAAGAPGSGSRSVHMMRTPGNGGDSWVVAETDDGDGTPLVSIDELSAQHPDVPLLLKVDVQGYEPQVLAGGSKTFQRARLTVIEYWPYGIRRMGYDPDVFVAALLNNRHRVALMSDEHKVQPVNWIPTKTAKTELGRLSADGKPEQQVEIILGGIAG